MRGSKADIPVFSHFEETINWQIEWGGMNVSIEIHRPEYTAVATPDMFQGDFCQCPHWGFVIKGRLSVRYKDHEEVIQAGDVYYLEPGHHAVIQVDGEIVEFSPALEYQQTLELLSQKKNITIKGD